MALSRTWYNTLVDDSGLGTDGTIIDKVDVDTLLDIIDDVLDAIDDQGALSFAAPSELTIASDAVTITAGNNVFSIDTQADAASDDLSTITLDAGGRACRLLILKPENVARVVTVKHNVGNIQLKGGDFAMNDANHRLLLYRDGTTWYEIARSSAVTTPGGSDTQVQFNDSSGFGGDAGLTYAKTTDTLTLAGPLVISGAAAGQIVFPAAQNASGGANTLDDYEEGSWTPVIGGSGGESGQTYSQQIGRYVKIGRLVHLYFRVVLSVEGTITGNVQIKNLPFTSANIASIGSPTTAIGFSALATSWVAVYASTNDAQLVLNVTGNTAAATSNGTALTAADIGDSTEFNGTLVYLANA